MLVRTTFDSKSDVLCVRLDGARVYTSREHALDPDLIVSYDHARRIVGVRLERTSLMRGMWGLHPARHCLPTEIRTAIDRFSEWFDASPDRPDEQGSHKVPPAWLLDATSSEPARSPVAG